MNKTKRIVIVANGDAPEFLKSQLLPQDYFIGVDRSAFWLIEHGIVPDVAIGDFDSVTRHEMSVIKKTSKSVSVYSSKKDATDLELAIYHAISLHPDEVLIFGALGTRLDHSYVAIQLLEIFIGSGISAVIRNEKNECALCNSKYILDKNDIYKYFSILPVTDTVSVTITGCAYPLKQTIIKRGSSLGISNEIASVKAKIVVHKGIVLIIRSHD